MTVGRGYVGRGSQSVAMMLDPLQQGLLTVGGPFFYPPSLVLHVYIHDEKRFNTNFVSVVSLQRRAHSQHIASASRLLRTSSIPSTTPPPRP